MERLLCRIILVGLCAVMVLSCTMSHRVIRSGRDVALSQTAKKELPKSKIVDTSASNGSNITMIKTDSTVSYITDVEIDEQGQAISVVNIDQVVVTSTLKSIPERFGYITVDFKVTVPKELEYKRWSIILRPLLHRGDSLLRLDPIVLRGEKSSIYQQRAVWRYGKYRDLSLATAEGRQRRAQQQYSDYSGRVQFFEDKYSPTQQEVDRRLESLPYYAKSDATEDRTAFFVRKYNRVVTSIAHRQSRGRSEFFKNKYESIASAREKPELTQSVNRVSDEYRSRVEMFAKKYTPLGEIESRREYVMSADDSTYINKVADAKDKFVLNPHVVDARLDSVVVGSYDISYHYKQDIRTDENTSRLKLTIDGHMKNMYADRVVELQSSDTLTYTVSSMISFIDYAPRYVYKIISKYATVNDRSWTTYPLGKAIIVDTLGDNRAELNKVKSLMSSLLYQYEFFVDSIILTAASSPEGRWQRNEQLSKQRAYALRDYLVKEFDKDIDTLITVRWIGEDWARLSQLIMNDPNIKNREQIVKLIRDTKDADRRDMLIAKQYSEDFKYIKDNLYPKLRSVSFKYDLRRVGMVQDTVYTTQIDSVYMQGIDYLAKRKYGEALRILDPYKDINSAITLMSLGYDSHAYDILVDTPQTPQRDYMLSVLCARMKRIEQGMEYYKAACEAMPSLEFRGNLDPEVQFLLRNYKNDNDE